MPARDGAIRIPEKLGVVVGVEVHEAGHHVHAGGIDHFVAIVSFEPAELGDFAIFYADISLVAWHPRAIHDHSAFNHYIKFGHARSLQLCGVPAGDSQGRLSLLPIPSQVLCSLPYDADQMR